MKLPSFLLSLGSFFFFKYPMELNAFSSFFEIFAGLSFLYAGSETFRFAFNETILSLDKTMNEIIKNTRVEIGKSISSNPKWATASIEKKRKVLGFVDHIERVLKREDELRKFPNIFKSVFLITGFFCLSVLILGGFQQFFLCSLTTVINLCCLIGLVGIYNFIIFALSFHQKRCGQNMRAIYPISIVLSAIIASVIYINISSWLNNHYEAHINELNQIQDNLSQLNQQYLGSLIKDNLKNSFYSRHARVDERIWITLALLVTVLPFILHLIRVIIHRRTFRNEFNKLKIEQGNLVKEFEETEAGIVDEILERINNLTEKKEDST